MTTHYQNKTHFLIFSGQNFVRSYTSGLVKCSGCSTSAWAQHLKTLKFPSCRCGGASAAMTVALVREHVDRAAEVKRGGNAWQPRTRDSFIAEHTNTHTHSFHISTHLLVLGRWRWTMWVLCQVTGHPMLAADSRRVFMCFASLLNTLTHTRTLGNRRCWSEEGKYGEGGLYIYI